MEEEWRDIKGYEGIYQISNFGRIKAIPRIGSQTKQIRYLKPQKYKKSGYMYYSLNKNGKKKFKVHRLVAEAFIPNPNNLPQVNHKDENKQNNNVNNLEWCNASYNYNYGTCKERAREKKKIPIIQKNKNNELIKIYDSLLQASLETGIKISNISSCINKRYKTSGGFIWEKLNKEMN